MKNNHLTPFNNNIPQNCTKKEGSFMGINEDLQNLGNKIPIQKWFWMGE
jgi:hypothetical protein